MNTTTRTSTAERLGRAFGRGWRLCSRRTAGVELAGIQGTAASWRRRGVWIVKLAALGCCSQHLLAGSAAGVGHGGCLDVQCRPGR